MNLSNFSAFNEFLLAIILGITQGITEFLPVSSTAHIRILTGFLTENKDIGLVTSNIIQLGTTMALIQIFWPDLKVYFLRIKEILFNPKARDELIKNWRFWQSYSKEVGKNIKPELLNEKYAEENKDLTLKTDIDLFKIAIGTLPIVILGFLLSSYVESSSIRSFSSIGIFLFVGSLLMLMAESIYAKSKTFIKPNFWTFGESMMVGLFQFLAIFPGMSRSGSTISGALFLGRDRKESVRFSFLISIPSILLAGVYGILKAALEISRTKNLQLLPNSTSWNASTINLSVASILLALVLSYVVGFISLKWLLSFLSSKTFRPFIIYRLLLALFLIFGASFFVKN